MLRAGVDKGFHVFGEARSAIAAARIEELCADTGIGADALAHHVDIGSDKSAQIGYVVHERDARGKH